MIPWEVAGALGLRPEISRRRVDMITASGVESVPLVKLKAITVFDKRIDHLEVVVHDLPPRSYVDGLLGLNYLRNYKFSLDLKHGILETE